MPSSYKAAAKLEVSPLKRGSACHVMSSEIESLIDWKDERLSAKMNQTSKNAIPSFKQLNQLDTVGNRFKN